jgi:hypothetical protein|tara:strand:- start:141 stop:1754 length:1614 start_codon:yes stop_codon:yes gene_type:complete
MLAALQELVRDSEALPPLPAREAAHLSRYLDVSARWLDFAQAHLPLLTVIASRPYNSTEPTKHLWLRHISVYLLLCLRNRVNHHTQQQGVAALLSYYQLKQQPLLNKQRLSSAIKQLSRFGQQYWAAHVLPARKRPPLYSDCFDIAWLWQRYLLRAPVSDFNDILAKLAMTLPVTGQQLLHALTDYPGLLHEGLIIASGQHIGPVMSQLKDQVLIYSNTEEHFCWLAKKQVRLMHKQSLSVEHWVSLLSKLDEQPEEGEVIRPGDHGWALPVSYPTSRPPLSLQTLLKALNDADIAVDKIVAMVEVEPAFSHFLTDAASKDNRMQLPVQNVKQSILTYGLERVGHMLVQYALFQRLTQHWFPLLDWYSRLAQTAILLSSELANGSGRITPQYASLVTTVALSPLFTSAQEKGKTAVNHNDQRLFDVTTLLQNNAQQGNSATRQRLISLASAWEQDKGQSRLIACCGRLPQEVPGLLRLPHCISGLSLIWARQWLLGHKPCAQTTEFIQQTQQAFPQLTALQSQLQPKVSHLLNCPLT